MFCFSFKLYDTLMFKSVRISDEDQNLTLGVDFSNNNSETFIKLVSFILQFQAASHRLKDCSL